MVDEALLILYKLSTEEKNVLKTFEKRILALYPFKQKVSELVDALEKTKNDPALRQKALVFLNEIQSYVQQMFANLDFTSAADEKKTLDKFAQDKKHIYEELLRDQAGGGAQAQNAGKKIAQILRDTEEELKAIGKAENALEHFNEAVRLFQGMIKHERQIKHDLEALAEETRAKETPLDIDHLMLEWKDIARHVEKAILEEKIEVYDRLQPLLDQKIWAETLITKYEKPRRKWLIFTQKITKQDIEKDLATISTPEEFLRYQSLLLKHANLLAPEAIDYLQKEAKVKSFAMTRTSHLASRDALTGLLNRHAFEPLAQEIIVLALRQRTNLGFIMFDIDDFGKFNKKYGEEMGDKVLAKVAEITRKHIRKSDVACRWGGEEIMIIAPDTSATGAATLAETLREAIAQESSGSAPEPVTVSVGVAVLKKDGLKLDQIMHAADTRMRYSKAQGKNKVTMYQEPKQPITVTTV